MEKVANCGFRFCQASKQRVAGFAELHHMMKFQVTVMLLVIW